MAINKAKILTSEAIDEDIKLAKAIHGDKYEYVVRIGTQIDLRTLNNKQRVCASRIKGHHILMTEI